MLQQVSEHDEPPAEGRSRPGGGDTTRAG
jgi:hypothetical protein